MFRSDHVFISFFTLIHKTNIFIEKTIPFSLGVNLLPRKVSQNVCTVFTAVVDNYCGQ